MNIQMPDLNELFALLLGAPAFVLMMVLGVARSIVGKLVMIALGVTVAVTLLVSFGIVEAPVWWPL